MKPLAAKKPPLIIFAAPELAAYLQLLSQDGEHEADNYVPIKAVGSVQATLTLIESSGATALIVDLTRDLDPRLRQLYHITQACHVCPVIGVVNGDVPNRAKILSAGVDELIQHSSLSPSRLIRIATSYSTQSQSKRLLSHDVSFWLDQINDLSLNLNRAKTLSEVYTVIIEGVSRLMGGDCGVSLFDPLNFRIKIVASSSSDKSRVGTTISLTGNRPLESVIATGMPVIAKPENLPPTSSQLAHALTVSRIEETLIVPIIGPNNLIGTVACHRTKYDQPFSAADISFMQTLVSLLGGRISQLQSAEREATLTTAVKSRADDLARREQYAGLMNEIILSASEMDAAPLLQKVAEHVYKLFKLASCYILLWDDVRQVPILMASVGASNQAFYALSLPHENKSLTQTALDTGQPLIVDNTHEAAYLRSGVAPNDEAMSILVLPLISGGRRLGSLLMGQPVPYKFSQSLVDSSMHMARYVATGLLNIELFEATRRKYDALMLRFEIAAASSVYTDLNALFDFVTERLIQAIYSDNFGIMLLDSATGRLTPHPSYRAENFPIETLSLNYGEGICGTVAFTGQTVRVGDVATFENYWDAGVGTRSELCVPIKVGNEVFGVINAESEEFDAFTIADERLLTTIAEQLGAAIKKIRLHNSVQQRNIESEELNKFSRQLRAVNDVRATINLILPRAMATIEAVQGRIFLVDAATKKLYVRGSNPDVASLHTTLNIHEGLPGQVLALDELYFSPDFMSDAFAQLSAAERVQLRTAQAAIGVPLRSQGWQVGVLMLYRPSSHPLTPKQTRELNAISEVAGNALDRTHVLETLEQRVRERTTDLETANEQLKQLDQLKSKFVNDVSHELRTPITNLRLYLDLLDRGSPNKRQQYLEVLRHQTQRLETLLDDTLNLSRIDLRKTSGTRGPLMLNEVIEPIVIGHQPQAAAKSITLRFIPGAIPAIYAAVPPMQLLVINLLTNAINFTPAGIIHISTFFDATTNTVALTIEDSGVGIAEEDIPHIFERFYRSESVSQSPLPGNGLGLAIVDEVVRLYDGSIAVETTLGEGTIFTLHFPAIDQS